MRKKIGCKGLILLIIMLSVGASIIPTTIGTMQKVNSDSLSGEYIQGLIDNASTGDTIYIPSGIYYENIIINKSINLIGENKNTTIIDGNGNGVVVYVSADWINISGFTIRNSGQDPLDSGIITYSSYNNITGNTITNNRAGIQLYRSINGAITGNTITNNQYGIFLEYSSNNFITANNISLSYLYGIHLLWSNKNSISENNFIENNKSAYFKSLNFMGCKNTWKHNYWNRPRILPKLIFGPILYRITFNSFMTLPWLNIDWHPAQEPYVIS